MTGGIDMQYPVDSGEDYTYRPIEYVTLRRADLHAMHGDMAVLESALEAVQADDAALRQRLAEVEALADRYGVWMRATEHPCTYTEWRARMDSLVALAFEDALDEAVQS